MTEDEAKTKWCPFVRLIGWNGQPAGHNRVAADTLGTVLLQTAANCVGGVCMAWRWSDAATQARFARRDEPAPGPEWVGPYRVETSDERFAHRWERPFPNRSGFCGLAGAPQ